LRLALTQQYATRKPVIRRKVAANRGVYAAKALLIQALFVNISISEFVEKIEPETRLSACWHRQ
jgi:hypothetical protein